MTALACVGCGNSVPPSLGNKPRKWCSNACHVRAWEARTGRSGRAPRCAVSFPTCAGCGAVFAARAGGKGYKRATCSDSCHKLWRAAVERERLANMNPEQRERRKERKHLRRAIEYGVDAERFKNVEVFERDGWVCGICSKPVDPDKAYPDRMCASLDHVVPLSLGGAHTRANTRCSHLHCNVARSNRVEAVAS